MKMVYRYVAFTGMLWSGLVGMSKIYDDQL
jgi:hypothetical protein